MFKNSERDFSFHYVVNTILILTHLAFFIRFSAANYHLLSIFSIAGFCFYAFCYLLIHRKIIKFTMILAMIELVAFQGLNIIYLGWDSGFQYMFLCTVPILFMTDLLKIYQKIFLSAVCIISYVLLFAYIGDLQPIIGLSLSEIRILNISNIIGNMVAIGILFFFYNILVLNHESKLNKKVDEFRTIAYTDHLTGAYNRKFIEGLIKNEINKYMNTREKFVIAIADIDKFKQINDKYGHDAGDQALIEIVKRVNSMLRQSDFIARWGGDELLFFFQKTDLKNSLNVIKRIQRNIADVPMEYNDSNISLSMTIGVKEFAEGFSMEELIAEADRYLYKGKSTGNNSITCADESIAAEVLL